MKRAIHQATTLIQATLGLDPAGIVNRLTHLARFMATVRQYRGVHRRGEPFPIEVGEVYPILVDFDGNAGAATGHYFFQDLWAARKIHDRRPGRHLDVGSRIDGFVAHLLSFMPVSVIDVRPLGSTVAGLDFIQEDATTMARFPDDSVESLSSLHAIEHFGLGRYGDPIDPSGWCKALGALERVVARHGRLYLSVPIGRERLCFNAHRVFSPTRIIEVMRRLHLLSFSAVDDSGALVTPARPEDFLTARFACGLYEFTKP